MSTQSPTVSVAMAVYNAECYVSEAIDSILNQTFTDFELLMIDDGSTDGSLKILQDYAAKDDRIRLTHQKNQGVSRTRNTLLHQARGEFIAVMDADDVALPDRFALQVDFLQKHSEIVCVGGHYQMIDSNGKVLNLVKFPDNNADIQQLLISGSSAIQHGCGMIRRSSLLAVGGYDETMMAAMDFDLWLRLGEIGQLANLNHLVLQYRIHGNSISERLTQKQGDYVRQACERAWQRRGIQGTYQGPNSWRHEFIVECGWRAFNSGNRWECFVYGLRAVRSLPSDIKSWKLLACSVVKQLPKPNSQ